MVYKPDWFSQFFDNNIDEDYGCIHEWEFEVRLGVYVPSSGPDYLTIGCEKICSICGLASIVMQDNPQEERTLALKAIAVYYLAAERLGKNKKNPSVHEFLSYDERARWIEQHEPE